MNERMRQKRPRKKENAKPKKNVFMYLRLFVCISIIAVAVVFKHINAPIVEKLTQAVNEDLQIDQAVDAISNVPNLDDGIAEVFKEKDEGSDTEDEEESQPVFGSDFYLDTESREIEKEIEEERKRAETEAKELSVETLSFQMSEEELSDDTAAEPFRIPPPSYCSYDKESVSFKYQSPLYGIITSKFGYRDHPIIEDASFHTGLDIAAKKGSTISAFASGTVLEAGKNATYGNYLLIEHSDGIRSFYGHNSKLLVKKGQRVKLGQKVAEVGSTGMSTGPHLHFEIRKGNVRLDPALYISPETV